MSLIWGDSVLNQWNPEITATVGAMSPEEIFKYYAKSIGSLLGGVLGILFLIPFRKYFVSNMHGNTLSPRPPQRRRCLYREKKAAARQNRC